MVFGPCHVPGGIFQRTEQLVGAGLAPQLAGEDKRRIIGAGPGTNLDSGEFWLPNDFLGPGNNGMFTPVGGTVLPTGGPKGYGMAMVVDTLCGVLTGANFGMDLQLANAKESKPGHFVWAIDVEQFMDRGEFEARMDERARGVKRSDRKIGVDEILIPGERGLSLKQESIARGTVQVSQETWGMMAQLKELSGVSLPGTF